MPTSSHNSDNSDPDSLEIAKLLRLRDPQVMDKLVAYAIPLSKNLAWRFPFLTEEDIEDIVYTTFLQVYMEGDQYDPQQAKIKTWLTKKAYFRVLTLVRQQKRLPSQPLTDFEEAPSRNNTPSAKEGEGPSQMMEALLQQLAPKRAKVVRLYYYEGMSEDMVAQQLNIKPSTIRVHLHHARNDLRRLIGGQDSDT